jgi:hypothetical protein
MRNIKKITGQVVNYCDIPEKLTEGKWFNEYSSGCYIECHIDLSDSAQSADELDNWLMNNYPGIENETFYIEINY